MTRSSFDPLYDLDPKIELTLHRLRKARNFVVSNSSNSVSSFDNSTPVTNTFDSIEYSSTNNSAEQMENNNKRTLKELATPDVVRRSPQALEGIPCGLLYNETTGDTGRLHQDEGISILPGWSSKRLAISIVSSIQHLGRNEAYVLGELPEPRQPGRKSVGSGNILEKPCMNTRKDLTNSTPHVHIIISVDSLTMMDWSMIYAGSGGPLMDKTSAAARHLISNMASNTQQFGIRGASQSRMVNEISVVDNLRLENQLIKLTSLVRQLAVGQHQTSRSSQSLWHMYFRGALYRYVPHVARNRVGLCRECWSHTWLPGWEATVSESAIVWKASVSAKTEFRAICSSTIRTCPECTSKTNRLLIIDSTISSTTVLATATIENAISRQFTISRGPNEAIGNQQPGVPTNHELYQYCEPFTVGWIQQLTLTNNSKSKRECECTYFEKWKRITSTSTTTVAEINQYKTVPLSFSTWTISTKKFGSDEELRRMFRKVEINIPLLDVIKQIPKYAKFLKELCVHKRKKMKRSVAMGGIVTMSTSTTIGDCTFTDAMLDLGASINVMPTSTYKSLKFDDMEPTGMTIQLVNRSVVQPLGVLEDVLVQVNELIFPTDFYVLDMEDETSGKEPP
ncbi:hypothetical protein CR513_24785, partial [Mucuna pruriens]